MGKKKVEMYFKMDLEFAENALLNKYVLKSYLEEKIKGLKITTYENFIVSKSSIRADVISNTVSLLHAEDLLKESYKIGKDKKVSAGTISTEKEEAAFTPEKLLEKIKIILGGFDEKKKTKTFYGNLRTELDSVENITMAIIEQFSKMKNENLHLKASFDNLMQMGSVNMSQMNEFLAEKQMEQTAALMKNLQNENEKIMKKNQEMQEMIGLYQKKQGDKVLQDQIAKLEKIIQENEIMHNVSLSYLEDCNNSLRLQLFEAMEKIRELEQTLKGENKDDIVNTKKELETIKARYNEIDEKYKETEMLASQLKSKLNSREEHNKQLTSDLAKALEQHAALEEQNKDLTKDLSQYIKPVSMFLPKLREEKKEEKKEEQATKEENKKEIAEPAPTKIMEEKPINANIDNKRLEEIEEILKKKNNSLSNLTSLLSAKEEEITGMIKDYKELEEAYAESEKELKATKSQLVGIYRETEDITRKSINASNDNPEVKAKISKLEKEIARREEEKIELQKMIEERNLIIRNNEDKFIEYETMKEKFQSVAVIPHKATNAEFEIKLEQNQNLIKKLDSELEEKISLIQKQEDIIKQKKEAQDKLEQELNVQRSKLNDYEAKVMDAVSQNISNQNVIEGLNAKIKEMQAANEKLKKHVETSNADSSKLLAEIEEKNKVISDLQKQIAKEPKNVEENVQQAPHGHEKQKTSKVQAELEANRLTISKLEAEVKRLTLLNEETKQKYDEQVSLARKLQIENKQTLINEQIKIQEDQEKQQSSVQALNNELNERNLTIKKLNGEIQKLQEIIKKKDEQIAELDLLSKKSGKELEDIKKKLELKAKNVEVDYLNEVVYLYKTIVSSSKERIEEKKFKIEKLNTLNQIIADMSSPKITKENLRDIVVNAFQYFPYLGEFDLKNDYKFIVSSIIKIINHKKDKEAVYEADNERNNIVLEYAVPKLEAYSQKLNQLLSHAK